MQGSGTTATIDLVADMGESYGQWRMGDDDAFLEIITSANIACGYHAGDPRTMDRIVSLCAQRGIGIGAHPSFPDRVGFGRRMMELSETEVRTDIIYQLGALQAFAAAHGTKVTHLCPHGKLGNSVITRPDYAKAMVDAIYSVDPSIVLYTQPGQTANLARERGLRIAMVGNIDRSYEDDGTLTPRGLPGAVLTDPEEIAARTIRLVKDGILISRNGKELQRHVDTILLHSDGANGLGIAKVVRQRVAEAGITIHRFASI
ncbi:LamB/YcsF family protein [Bifidobacterium sp.]|jgi:UPF0271 protein|uniref:LamB/YcsF family protein n=1 Tax=Bifidobacterium sp. TaxID=41200 RepID=UPI0025BD6932|nr:5-oxoprolinase subunit PxpA [Bifidobacterium sp.]MCI1225461.1 5-oxoprolinase subunit PxpA [Bifidobacterium sp.]